MPDCAEPRRPRAAIGSHTTFTTRSSNGSSQPVSMLHNALRFVDANPEVSERIEQAIEELDRVVREVRTTWGSDPRSSRRARRCPRHRRHRPHLLAAVWRSTRQRGPSRPVAHSLRARQGGRPIVVRAHRRQRRWASQPPHRRPESVRPRSPCTRPRRDQHPRSTTGRRLPTPLANRNLGHL